MMSNDTILDCPQTLVLDLVGSHLLKTYFRRHVQILTIINSVPRVISVLMSVECLTGVELFRGGCNLGWYELVHVSVYFLVH